MNKLVLNLDWGSCFLKGCAYLRMPPNRSNRVASTQLVGRLEGSKLQSWETLRSDGETSLKAAYLSGAISDSDLEGHRESATRLLSETMIQPLAGRLQTAAASAFETFVNIHTPLRLTRAEMVVGSGVFEVCNEATKLLRPAYRTLKEWNSLMGHPAQPRENRWGQWLMTCLQDSMAQAAGFGSTTYSLLPESITCVQDLANDIEDNKERQFIVLDVGHFTTDFALVAFLNWDEERMVVRRADSIFDAGSVFIKKHGQEAWVKKVMQTIARFSPSLMSYGILGYAPLGVVLIGGGTQELSAATREQRLIQAIHDWATQYDLYRDGVNRNTYLAPPPHIHKDFQVLPGSNGQIIQSQRMDLSLHIPSILACTFSDMRCPMRVQGEASLSQLRNAWFHRKQPFPEATPGHRGSEHAVQAVAAHPEPHPNGPHIKGPNSGSSKMSSRPVSKPVQPPTPVLRATRPSLTAAEAFTAVKENLSVGTAFAEQTALKLLNALAEKGYLDAALELASLHLAQRLVYAGSNAGTGESFLRYAAENGHIQARILLNDLDARRRWIAEQPGPKGKKRPSAAEQPQTPNKVVAIVPDIEAQARVKDAIEKIRLGDAHSEQCGLHILKELAKQDHPHALFHLGHLFLVGRIRHQSTNQSAGFHYLLRAAKKGYRKAYPLVADCYMKGVGTPSSIKAAKKWLALHEEAQKDMATA